MHASICMLARLHKCRQFVYATYQNFHAISACRPTKIPCAPSAKVCLPAFQCRRAYTNAGHMCMPRIRISMRFLYAGRQKIPCGLIEIPCGLSNRVRLPAHECGRASCTVGELCMPPPIIFMRAFIFWVAGIQFFHAAKRIFHATFHAWEPYFPCNNFSGMYAGTL